MFLSFSALVIGQSSRPVWNNFLAAGHRRPRTHENPSNPWNIIFNGGSHQELRASRRSRFKAGASNQNPRYLYSARAAPGKYIRWRFFRDGTRKKPHPTVWLHSGTWPAWLQSRVWRKPIRRRPPVTISF